MASVELLVHVKVTSVGLVRRKIAFVVDFSGCNEDTVFLAGFDKAHLPQVPLVTTGASSGTGNDNRTMGEKVKDALPGTGRGASPTGHSTGQGYGQEGRGLTSGTGQPVGACPAGGAVCANSQLYRLQLASLPVVSAGVGIACDLDLSKC